MGIKKTYIFIEIDNDPWANRFAFTKLGFDFFVDQNACDLIENSKLKPWQNLSLILLSAAQ